MRIERIETSVVINRPIEEVWAFLTDPFNAPQWSPAWLGMRQTSPGPLGVGSSGQGRVVILGFETRVSLTITEWNPPHAYAFSGGGGPFRSLSVRQTLEATADGTKVVSVSETEPRPTLKPLFWLLGPLFRRRADIYTRNIKRLLESGRG